MSQNRLELVHSNSGREPAVARSRVAESLAAKSLLESLPVAACVVDSQGRVEVFNTAWRKLAATHDFLRPLADRHGPFLDACSDGADEGMRDLGARVQHVLAYDGTLPHTHLSYEFAVGSVWLYTRIAPLPMDRACIVLCEDISMRRA